MVTSNDALRDLLAGKKQKHRICFDFSNVPALQTFFAKCKADGITHPDSVPILIYQQDGSTIWVVGKNNPNKKGGGDRLIQTI